MKVLANDSITLTKIIDGADGTNSISVILSSYAINLPSNSEGAIIDYSNSQVNIIALEGQKSLIPTLSTSLNNGQFRLKNTTLKNIGSIAQPTIDKDKIKTGVISQFASNQDSGSAEFEIEYKTSTGDINTVNMTLTFTKAKQGLAGTPGKDGKPVFTSIRYSNEICDRENFIPTTATINPNADTFSIGVYTGEIDYDSPNNHWEQNLDKYKWSAYGQQSIKEIKTTFKATSSMNKPNSVDFKDTNIPSDFNAQNKYLWKKDIYFYNGTNTTTESINLIATYGKDGQSANTLSATSGSYSINKSEVIITGNSAHTDALNSTGTNLFIYNYDGSLAEKINYNTYSDPNLCNTLLTKIQGLRDKIFVLMGCDSGSMTQQLRNELILSGGSQTDIWNKQRRAWIFISLSKKSTNNQYPLQKGQAYEVSNIGDNKKESLTVSLTGSGIVANGSTGIGITSIQTKYQATNSASKPTQGWGDSTWSITIPTLTDNKKYLYSITRYTYSDNRTTDIIDLISVKGSDGENGKILYQDTVPVAPSIGTQWFNTGTNNGYINNTLYVFDGKNWKVMEFSAENIKTNVLNALQANMDNTNISHKLIVGNKTGKRVELDGYNGTLTIYNSNNQKVFYTGADGNLNFQGNLSFSSGSSVSEAIDEKADTSFVNSKVDNITSSDVNNLFIDSEFYNLDAIKSNWYRSNLKVLENEDYAGSRVLYWNGTGAGWGYLQFQSVIIPSTLNNKVTVGFNYRYSTEDQFLASFYFMNADNSQILKKHEVWFRGTTEQANIWQTFSMTADIPDGTDHIDFKIFANGSKILNFSRPRIYAGFVDWGYNINPAYSQSQLDNKADTSYVNNKVDDISIGGTNILKNTEKMDNSTGNYWVSEGKITLQDGVATVKQQWASREYLLDDLNKYIENNDVKNKKYILSVDIMRTTQDVISNSQIRFYLEQSGSHAAILVDDLSKLPINKWVRKSVSIILLGQNETSLTRGRFRIECTTDNEWKFRRMKLEEGTKATDWSPSPEDNASQSDLNNTNNRLNGVDSNLNGLLNTGTNCWINSNFADGLNHWWKQNNNIQLKLDGEYLGTKVLDIKVPTNAGLVSAGTQERYPVTPGEKLSFSWWQNLIVTSSNNTFGEIQCYKDTTSGRIGTARLAPSDQTVNKWVLMKSEGWTVPKDCYYIGVNFCFSTNGEMKITQPQFVHGSKIPNYQPSPNDLNNIQSDVDLNKSQIQSQQTQLNQKPDRTEIIASSNDNPRAYFQVGTFSSGPNAGRGYVSVGADYGFFLKTNTFIEDGFVLSAKHISAGQLVANTPAWITSSTDNWKVDKNSYVTKYDLDRSNIFLGPTGMTNKAFTAMSLENGGIQFLYDNNGNTRAGFKTVGYMVPYVASSSTPEIQILGASAKYGLSIIGDDTAPYNRLLNDKGRVFIGKDSLAGEGTAAIASNTVYTCRLQSLRDSDNNGISVDDRLLIDEGLWSKWNRNGKQTHIDFPNKNGGDVIEFHTAEGDGAFGDYKAYFQMVNGNWRSDNVDAQHHAIVVGGNGYILSFSNEDTTDNAQGNGNAVVVAKKFVTNSSKELKTDIQPISDIDQAVKDILKIEPKQYLYQSQVDQLSEWEDNGKPADTFKHLDTEINVGLIAEEMDEYDSLRPFIEKVSDEEGNEGILGIDYSKLTPLLLAVCQKQDNKINELEEQIVRLELLMNKNF